MVGPQRLREPLNETPSNKLFEGKDIQRIVLKEEKRNCVVNVSEPNVDHMIFRYSSRKILVRINAWYLRYLDNARNSLSN